MPLLRRSYRLVLLALHLLLGAGLTLLLAPRDPARPFSDFHRAVIRWWHRRLCRVLGLKVHVRGQPAGTPALLVSNHVSWLDIPVIGGAADLAFLSKAEVRRWPVIGWLAYKSGTLFIERGGKNASNAASEVMTFQLLRGRSVLVFPEGTTSEGETVRRFHPRLFAAAQLAERPVQPVALRFRNGGARDTIAPFVGDDSFPAHMWRVLGTSGIEVELVFCPPLGSRGVERRVLAEQAQAHVAALVEGAPHEIRQHPGA